MNKKILLFMAPVSSRSGYGERARDLILAIKLLDKYEIHILDTPWGSTPRNVLNESNTNNDWIKSRFVKNGQMPRQPEIFVQLTVPNEFMGRGSQICGSELNIGVTAGIETNKCSAPWIDGCNRMDVVFTSSEHSKSVFLNSSYQNQQQQVVKVIKPVEVLFEGVDLTTYFHKQVTKSDDILKDVSESSAFLFVGHWLPGALGQDRKDVGMMIYTFIDTFKQLPVSNKEQPALVLKTSGGTYGPVDLHSIESRLTDIRNMFSKAYQLPNIYVIHGDLTSEEMNTLYNSPKVIGHISFTKGEGYGRPLAEASLSKKPILVSNWSGLVDFCKYVVFLPGSLTNVHPSAQWKDVIDAGTSWYTVNYQFASAEMKKLFTNPALYKDNAFKQAHLVKTQYSFVAMTELVGNLLEQYDIKRVLPLNLPKLPTLTKVVQ